MVWCSVVWRGVEGADGIGGRIAYIVTFITILSIKSRFEREYTENLIAVLCDIVYAPFFPCPDFRWDIIDDSRVRQVLVAEQSYV